MIGYTPSIRLFVNAELAANTMLSLTREQAHYLGNVMRRSVGDRLEIFNGQSDSFVAEIVGFDRKSAEIRLIEPCASFRQSPDIWFLFVPIKRTRLDFMAQKATELGARRIQPIRSEFCQVSRVNIERLQANAVEAAEQTGRLDVPDVDSFVPLPEMLTAWPSDRHLLFCDEVLSGDAACNPIRQLSQDRMQKAGLLIGPEGGFSATERKQITDLSMTRSLSLGPRILRSDTAALAALSLFQAVCGDWSVC